MQHKIFTDDILRRLMRNGESTRKAREKRGRWPDHVPVVKVFNPYGGATWILTELDEDGDTLFGLCDLGTGYPELGTVSKQELETTRVRPTMRLRDLDTGNVLMQGTAKHGLPLERDAYFSTTHPLSVWARAADKAGRITDSDATLREAASQDQTK